jgi:hypothetical protein
MADADQRSRARARAQRRIPIPAEARPRQVLPRDGQEDAGDLDLVQLVQQARRQADDARRPRLAQNRVNQAAYLGRQDWTGKQPGQSREFLPKTGLAAEQISMAIKTALTAFGDWFEVELSEEAPLTGDQARAWLEQEFDLMHRVDPGRDDFATVVADAVKMGLLNALCILKIHGRMSPRREWTTERQVEWEDVPVPDSPMTPGGGMTQVPRETVTLKQRELRRWHLVVDLVAPEDYYPDPTGRRLYEIHRVVRDLADVRALAEEGVYERAAVDALEAHAARAWDDYQRQALRGQAPSPAMPWRPEVTIDEYWGTITSPTGRVLHENIVCAIGNDRVVLRKPSPNPFWHGQSPFVVAPILRVPLSVWHKALFDGAVSLNLALNELFSLMLDGGLAAVWGTRQVRPGYLEDPRQISQGVPQGATLVVKDEVPFGAKAVETLSQGNVPQDGMQMFQMVNNEFNSATLLSDLQRGQVPPRQTTATAVVQATQQSQSFYGTEGRELEEKLLEPALWKSWCTLLQHAEDVRASDVAVAVGPEAAIRLARMPAAERFATMAQGARIKVTGVSAVGLRGQTFQKLLALMQVVSANPMLLQAFMMNYSAEKVLQEMLRALTLDPRTIETTPEERQQQAVRTMATAQAQAQGGGPPGAPPGGGPPPGIPAAIRAAGGPTPFAEPVPAP